MIVLDTNVLSELMKLAPERSVLAWMGTHPPASIRTTAVTIFEVRQGLARLPAGWRREALAASFDQVMTRELGGRILDFDAVAASEAAAIVAKLAAAGRPIEVRDAMIAGTVAAHGGTLATRNVKHFADTGIPLVDPWAAGP